MISNISGCFQHICHFNHSCLNSRKTVIRGGTNNQKLQMLEILVYPEYDGFYCLMLVEQSFLTLRCIRIGLIVPKRPLISCCSVVKGMDTS